MIWLISNNVIMIIDLFHINRYDPKSQFRLAIGSYVERYTNCIQIIKKKPTDKGEGTKAVSDTDPSSSSSDSQMYKACEFDHPYPW